MCYIPWYKNTTLIADQFIVVQKCSNSFKNGRRSTWDFLSAWMKFAAKWIHVCRHSCAQHHMTTWFCPLFDCLAKAINTSYQKYACASLTNVCSSVWLRLHTYAQHAWCTIGFSDAGPPQISTSCNGFSVAGDLCNVKGLFRSLFFWVGHNILRATIVGASCNTTVATAVIARRMLLMNLA